jgi:hypothetical protein
MSTQAKRLMKRRIHMALLLVAMLFLLVTSSAPRRTSAQSGCLWRARVKYYSDASMTYQCGSTIYLCDGTVTHSGCYTDYVTILECQCAE